MTDKLIAIPIAAPTVEEAIRRVPQAETLADIIEFRLDYLRDFSLTDPLPDVTRLLLISKRPVILTYHPNLSQQSKRVPTFQQQIAMWRSLFALAEERSLYFDLDLRLAEWFHAAREPVPWDRIIASYHDFKETPVDLSDVYERMKATRAAVLKVATQAQNILDNLALYTLLEQARRENRRLIALAMGQAGIMSRILSPAWGGFLTFGALTADEQTAPGQLTAHQLRSFYRVPKITSGTNIAGVIGDSVQHSFSPALHNAAYERLNLDWVYLPLLVRDLERFMLDFVNPRTRRLNWNLRGLSVTIPHKIEILKYLDIIDAIAGQVGAVNTVVIESGTMIGYNTDVEGAMRPLRERLGLSGIRAVVLGAGGAARAVGFGLKQGGAQVTILARNKSKAGELAKRLGGEAGTLKDLTASEYDVLINATPVGMGDTLYESPVPTHLLRPETVVFDLVARPEETKLLRDARERGCHTINGLEMLVHQAARQFELWTNEPAPIETMFHAVLPALRAEERGSN
ncbi:MAG: shikimate dehydrogenase [Acidobacteria bacterium]|nr:shikimate dehydrogenase [Acidobacteriota bacterium]